MEIFVVLGQSDLFFSMLYSAPCKLINIQLLISWHQKHKTLSMAQHFVNTV